MAEVTPIGERRESSVLPIGGADLEEMLRRVGEAGICDEVEAGEVADLPICGAASDLDAAAAAEVSAVVGPGAVTHATAIDAIGERPRIVRIRRGAREG